MVKWVRSKADLELDEHQALVSCIGITHDITDRKLHEEELRRAVQTRDEVLGVVAHDLRNPLGAIVMQAEILGHLAVDPEGQFRTPAEAIERAAKRMNRLIQDLLDVARLEEGGSSSRRPASRPPR